MTGSNKQITWAKEIKANLFKTYRAVMPMMPENDRTMLERAIAKLDSIDRAGIIIEAYKWVRFSGDPMEDISKIIACHNNMMPGELRQFVPEMHDEEEGEINMKKKYTVLLEYRDLWCDDPDWDGMVDEKEIKRLASEWGKTVEELMEQVEDA